MKAAVTGGSGVVGRAVLRHLVEAGHEVSALARTESAASIVGGLGARPVMGDVLDAASLLPLVSGADWVFHIAGVNQVCSPNPDVMDRVNVEGSRNVLEICASAGVGRIIHTSSAAALGESPRRIGSEKTSHRGWYHSRYERSKHLSELTMLSGQAEVDVVVVNPASVQGPGRSTGTGRLVLDLARGELPLLVETRISIIDIDDCARGHLLAAERGEPGQRYVLSGTTLTIREALALVSELTGLTSRVRFVPPWAATAAAAFVEAVSRLTGKPPRVCREMMRTVRAGSWYDGSLATRELGLAYTPIESTILRTLEWFRSEGLLG